MINEDKDDDSKSMKSKLTKDQIIEILCTIRAQYFDALAKGNDPKAIKLGVGFAAMRGGLMSGQMLMYSYRAFEGVTAAATAGVVGSGFTALVPGPLQIVATAMAYSAMVGIAHSRYKKGIISKKQYKKVATKGAAGAAGSLAGMIAGSFVGFAAGQVIIPIPVVGGIIGTVVGTVAGTIAGGKLAMGFYDKIETNIKKKRLQE